MEEILASIRQIIADDDAVKAPGAADEHAAEPPAPPPRLVARHRRPLPEAGRGTGPPVLACADEAMQGGAPPVPELGG